MAAAQWGSLAEAVHLRGQLRMRGPAVPLPAALRCTHGLRWLLARAPAAPQLALPAAQLVARCARPLRCQLGARRQRR